MSTKLEGPFLHLSGLILGMQLHTFRGGFLLVSREVLPSVLGALALPPVTFPPTKGGVVLNFDQCSYLDDPIHALSSGPKATALLAFGGLIEPVKREFSKKRCAHKKGTHRALRGADSYGKYYTAASAHYSARLCAGFARTVSAYLNNTVLHGEVSALVSGVLHGKRLPRNSVDAKFFHDSFNHGEQRVLSSTP